MILQQKSSYRNFKNASYVLSIKKQIYLKYYLIITSINNQIDSTLIHSCCGLHTLVSCRGSVAVTRTLSKKVDR